MKRLLIIACVVAAALIAADAAPAQVLIPPGGSKFNPPPPPPPPPKIEVPVVPQMDAPPRQSYVPATPAPSFGDRITKCQSDAAAAGLGPGDREEYSRNCANR